MDKKTVENIRKYENELLRTILLFKIISLELELAIENEETSIENLSDYPQFEDKVMDMESTRDELEQAKEKLAEIIISMGEVLEIMKGI